MPNIEWKRLHGKTMTTEPVAIDPVEVAQDTADAAKTVAKKPQKRSNKSAKLDK